MRQLLTSKKFIVMIAAAVVAVASKLGLNLDPDLVQQIVYLAIAFIVGQGIADHGKEAAKVEAASGVPVTTTVTETSSTRDGALEAVVTSRTMETTVKPTQAGFARVGLLLVISAIFGAGMLAMGCNQVTHSAAVAKGASKNCLSEAAKARTKEFGPAVKASVLDAYDSSTRQINWAPIKQMALWFTVDSGMCVLANVVADLLAPPPAIPGAPQSAPIDIDPTSLRSGFANIAGGVKYDTAVGPL